MEKSTRDKMRRRAKIVTTVLKFALLLIIVIGIPLYIWFGHHEIIEQFDSMDDVSAMLLEYKGYSTINSSIL